MATQTSVTNSGTTTTGALLSPAISAPVLATFGLSHAASTGGSKVFDWSDRANWSNGAAPSSLGGAAAVVVSAGTGGTNVDDIASLTISSLNFLAGAPALEIAAGNRLTITGAGTNGSIRLDANATLLEPNSGLSCITLAGSGARVEMGGVPRGYIAFSTVAGTSGSLFIAQPQAGTATAPGVDPQVIQNFAVGDHIYIEEKQTGSLTATYLPGSGAAGTLLISNGGIPVYEFTNFYGNPALNYQVAETAITDPLTGQAGIAALDVFVSAAAKPMNWLTGASTSSPGSNTAVVVSAGASGASIDYFPSLTISSLDFLAGAPGLEIAVGNTLTIAGAGTNGTIKLDANATLLEPNSGLSYVNLAGNGARVEMGAVPRGYIQFSTVAGTSGSLIIEQPQSHTATAPGVDSQVIQNFAVGDQIYIEERQTGPLTVTYTPGIGSTGTLLMSDGSIPIYEFNNFQGNSALNYQAGETTITDPLTGSVGASALDLYISTTVKSPTQTPNTSNPGSSGYSSTSSSPPASGPTTPPPVYPVPAPPPPSPPAPVAPAAPVAPLTTSPVIPRATSPGQIVGLVLQNVGATVLAAREITFGQEFQAGQVAAGAQLVAMIGGQAVAVQMDVKTTNPDGSVAMAILTLAQPAIAAGASTPVMLTLAPSGAVPGAPLDISALAAPGSAYNLNVNVTLHNGDGSTSAVTINAAQALAAALKSGAYSTWLSGPQATQVRIDVPVSGSLHVTMDITDYADGTTSTDVTFNNDIAMSASGGTAVYDATVTQNGAVVFQQNAITQYQYTSWDKTFASNGLPGVNVQHDVAALEKTGLIQNYDLNTGVDTSLITTETTQLANPGFNAVLGTAGISQYMPAQGGRWDIGPTTQANTIWLMTQNATTAQYALDQAGAAGSIPWALFDAKTGTYLTSTANPTLWADARAGGTYGTTALTQPLPSAAVTGWTPDPAHQPDLDYVAYLMTGDRHYLDELNAQASYDVLTVRPNPNGVGVANGRQGALGIVADGGMQVRAQAWSLREVVEAAAANPAGSAEKAYFTQIETNNFTSMLQYVGTLNEGEATGWMTGAYTAGIMAPWQQDFLATSVVLAAQQGNAAATQFLGWETNFLAGRFLNASNGFSPYLGAAYNLETYVPGKSPVTTSLQTWSAIAQQTVAANIAGPTPTTVITNSQYAQAARSSLAGDITVTGDPRAIQAFGWITAYASINAAVEQGQPYLNIAPRLSDGNLLTMDHITVTADTVARVIQGSATADQLIYETGAGNVTIQGGSGINILFAGTGSDTLQGGANNDYLFAGSGADVLAGGGGVNYMRAGSGADTFLLDASQGAIDTIADFKVGTDHLHVLASGGSPLSAAGISGLLAGATSDSAGGSVLHLSGAHSVTLAGIGLGQLSNSMFG